MRFGELTWLNDSQLVLMMRGFLSDAVPLLCSFGGIFFVTSLSSISGCCCLTNCATVSDPPMKSGWQVLMYDCSIEIICESIACVDTKLHRITLPASFHILPLVRGNLLINSVTHWPAIRNNSSKTSSEQGLPAGSNLDIWPITMKSKNISGTNNICLVPFTLAIAIHTSSSVMPFRARSNLTWHDMQRGDWI